MNKKIISSVLVAAMAVTMVGCQQNKPGSGDAKLPAVGATIYKYDDNFMSFVRTQMAKKAEKKLALTISDAQNDQAKLNELVDGYISKGVKALDINLVTPQAASAIIDKAKPKNLPVIFFNKEPDEAALNSYDKAYYVGTRSSESGELQGKLVAEQWKKHPEWDRNKDGIMQYVMLKGEPGHPDAEARTKFSVESITKDGIKVQQMELQAANWDTAKAKDIVDAWISKHGNKIEFVIANNDAMALGALAALEAAGFKGEKAIPIVGVDAIPDALTKIENGEMVGTVLNDAGNQAQAVIDLTLNLINGKAPTDGTNWKLEGKAVRVPYKAITKDNLKEAKDSYGIK
ncbi:Galactose/methyl galactoside ABC transport system, D-galactose-binding periplasmic protein MglB [Clostridiaceae bacterium JG1575]|nr:Galactose/methyl galactoside ABC transport system, D-galactose-binding periplasmic protein MglB [Clostridiaceae bacterium JG1575]